MIKNTTSQDPPLEILMWKVSVGSEIICRLTSTVGESYAQQVSETSAYMD